MEQSKAEAKARLMSTFPLPRPTVPAEPASGGRQRPSGATLRPPCSTLPDFGAYKPSQGGGATQASEAGPDPSSAGAASESEGQLASSPAEEVMTACARLVQGDPSRKRGRAAVFPAEKAQKAAAGLSTLRRRLQGQETRKNINAHITQPLNELSELYDARGAHGEGWKALALRRAAAQISRLDFRVERAEQLKTVQWTGSHTEQYVSEILATGTLSKLEAMRRDPKIATQRLLSGIWGVGPKTAESLARRGYRTLAQLRADPAAAGLTHQQRVGLELYEDLLTKIPREEVMAIESKVAAAAEAVVPGAKAIACGSYRRNAARSGDVDVIITDPNRAQRSPVLAPMLRRLRDEGFITHTLTESTDSRGEFCDTFMGVCRLSDAHRHRRLDIKVYPPHSFAFALLYFTGSGAFNRCMRFYAHKMGWSLSDHGLVPVVRTGADKHQIGNGITCATEREIFDALGLQYKPPASREIDAAVEKAGKARKGGERPARDHVKTPSATTETETWEDAAVFEPGTAASEEDGADTP